MSTFATEQENFWAGSFGDDYVARNRSDKLFSSNLACFARILPYAKDVKSIIEFGPNIGLNLAAIGRLIPGIELSGVEINPTAIVELKKITGLKVYAGSLLEFEPDYMRDLALIKGVLIHLDPEKLPVAYDLLYKATKRYICIAEYYNPSPMEIVYRGYSKKLFKRDFAGEILDRFPDLRLVDYGFVYHRDPLFPQDDITWFLMEKTTIV